MGTRLGRPETVQQLPIKQFLIITWRFLVLVSALPGLLKVPQQEDSDVALSLTNSLRSLQALQPTHPGPSRDPKCLPLDCHQVSTKFWFSLLGLEPTCFAVRILVWWVGVAIGLSLFHKLFYPGKLKNKLEMTQEFQG